MNGKALIDSFQDFKDEKNIDEITLMAIIEESIKNVLRKKYVEDDYFDVIINPKQGDLEIYINKTIVEDGALEDPDTEIELSEVHKTDPDFEVGEEFSQKILLNDLGRRSILALRQNLNSKLTEYDNSNIYEKFKDQVGEIVSGEVHHIRRSNVIILDEEQNEMILPKENQIPSDYFRKGETVRAVVDEVTFKGNKPQIVLSRTSPKFLEKLFEQEIPEIFDGLITIKDCVRIPGEKAKIAVESYDDRIDPVGASVGVKGSRIHSIVRELKNENIDVINYTTNLPLYITRAINPAKVSDISIDEENGKVSIYLKPEEVSRAIGRGGQNIKLASRLIGMEIDVFRDIREEDVELSEFENEIEGWIIDEFKRIGLDTAKSVLEKDREELVERLDLEEETIDDVIRILQQEFEE